MDFFSADFSFRFLAPLWLWIIPVLFLGFVGMTVFQRTTGRPVVTVLEVCLRTLVFLMVIAAIMVLMLVDRIWNPWTSGRVLFWACLTLVFITGCLLVWARRRNGATAERVLFWSLLFTPVVSALFLGALLFKEALSDPWVILLLAFTGIAVWLTDRAHQSTSSAIRLLILGLLVAAIAQIQLVRAHDRLTVCFLLDRSLSIPDQWRNKSIQYLQKVKRNRNEGDRLTVVAFAENAGVEIPPVDYDISFRGIETPLRVERTDLAGAIKLAQGLFPEDASKRIVILSDGNENIGNALEQARLAASKGIGIDVVPLQYRHDQEVLIEKVVTPPDAQQGDMINVRVVLRSMGPVSGVLTLFQRAGNRESVLAQEHVVLRSEPEINVVATKIKIQEPAFYAFQARFVPDQPESDSIAQNNLANNFTYVQGAAKILMIEPQDSAGSHDDLVALLQQENIEVDQISPEQLPTNLGEIQPYDAIVLANVPRELFSDRQMELLQSNTHDMGTGLIMLGGPESFGAGGWRDTPVEAALPVNMDIKASKVLSKGALVLIMHASEMAQGNYWQKVIAQNALRSLSGSDYAGLLHWDGREKWLWEPALLSVGENRRRMLASINRMNPGDMPDFGPSLQKARDVLWAREDAAIKHIIVISDGDPTPPTSGLLQSMKNTQPGRRISISSVAVSSHGVLDLDVMRKLAAETGGKFYHVKNPRNLPKIYQKEVRRISRPLIYERTAGVQPLFLFESEPLVGVSPEIPKVLGYVMTTPKENPLVQVPLVASLPDGQQMPILAHWRYGLGKTVAFTTDIGQRWATNWKEWESYRKLFSQMVRWSMRSLDHGNFTINSRQQNGKVHLIVDALDQDQGFQNFLNFRGTVVSPGMVTRSIDLKQTAPGRYEAVFEANQTGSYFASLSYDGSDGNQGVLRTGVGVSYSSEFRELQANVPLLRQLAAVVPNGGTRGHVIQGDDPDEWLSTAVFRHDLAPASASIDIWPWLVAVAGILFFSDVLVRRIVFQFSWIEMWVSRGVEYLRHSRPEMSDSPYMERLKKRKKQVIQDLSDRRTDTLSTRSENDIKQGSSSLVNTMIDREAEKEEGPSEAVMEEKRKQEAYTERLLKAKNRVWDDHSSE